MNEGQKDGYSDWAKAISSIKLTETVYVNKELPEEGRYKVISIAEHFYNPEIKVVTFYNLRDEQGTVHFMPYTDFVAQFNEIQV